MQFNEPDTGRTLVIIVGGMSESSQEEKDTISSKFLRIASDSNRWRAGRVIVREFDPRGRLKKKILPVLKEFPYTNTEGLLLLGKSAGAYELHNFVQGHLHQVLSYLKKAIVTIDPHYPFGKCGPDSPINARIYAPLISCFNVYQTEKYPRGAQVIGAHNFSATTDKGIDHFNIVGCQFATRVYLEGCYKTGIRRLT